MSTECSHGFEGGLRQGRRPFAAALAGDGRSRPIRGQLEIGHARELLRPVIELRLEDLALEPVPLPDRVIGVLDRQLGERRRLAQQERLVKRRQLADQDADRPAVGDGVVHGHHGDVLSLAQSQQRGADERSARQVKRPLRFFANAVLGLQVALIRGKAAQILHGQRQFEPGRR